MSQDNALNLLLALLNSQRQPCLWIADEHVAGMQIPVNPVVEVISNRVDVADALSKQGWNSRFSDLDFSHIDDGSLTAVYFRLAKEKALVNHVINQAARILKPGGQLFISGEKQQGIKTYTRKAGQCLAGKAEIKKHANHYLASISRGQQVADWLDDQDYPGLRATLSYEEIKIVSKPGQFGWNKLDKGSVLLAQQFDKIQIDTPSTILDLGCGYGLLSLAAHRQWPAAKISATDNNAAALISCQANFNQQAISGEVVAADCAATIVKQHDLVLCNPPFHQGFAVENQLTEQFISTAKRLCQPAGCALFVVNAFIPLERIAKKYFAQQQLLLNDGHFKLFKLYD
ncbi:MAG TPA: class I SAM-dependent methyltransferase [Candidatus Tenderia electrophaga]|uniref:Class I SAM-dependent methyltransferase n=1 Tax=Candidatus Tenderia electrophaga TaxID=1748243 RepID=A0A832N559_9GAMM|nr:class I SAM-dependent methyltransferase [Candidatus Tenderia electrophaga]